MLGRFRVLRQGEEIRPAAFGGRFARLVVRILAIQRGTLVPRDVLMDALWGERTPADPDANLDVPIHRGRRAAGDASLIITGSGGYALSDSDDIWIDAEAFRSAVLLGREAQAGGDDRGALLAFSRALDQWQGEPLAEDLYADWAQGWRQELQGLQLEALEGGARAALRLGEVGQATQLAEMAIVRESLREPSWLLLVNARARAGDRAGALAALDEYERTLSEELGIQMSRWRHGCVTARTGSEQSRSCGRRWIWPMASLSSVAELAAARGETRLRSVVAEALAMATASGHLESVRRLQMLGGRRSAR